jgi:Pyruvate/2-oxoacid:ferredoxin oxidoreductase delta subunit
MTTKNLEIFYFTGTGNSKNVASWMASAAGRLEIQCSLHNIAETEIETLQIPADALILFVSPVHGFNYPPVMLKFITHFPKGKNEVILMDTRAGMLIGNFNLPGLSGAAFLLSSMIFKFKGYSISGIKSVDLPSNWMSLHPALNEHAVRILHEINKKRVLDFAKTIFSGKRSYIPWYEFLVDLIVSPIAIGYYFAGRFMFAKSFYASGDCNDCDLCIKNCPVKAIIKIDNRPFWTFRCESCMRCMSNCPKKSIETAHGFILPFLIFSGTLTGLFFIYFKQLLFVIPDNLIRWIIETALFLLLLGIVHRVLHYLMRFRFVERLMVYTSLTKYKFWGKRYKALKP